MKYKPFLLLGIGLAIMAVFIYFIGVDQIWESLKVANLIFIGLAIVVQVIVYFLFNLRWKIINNTLDIDMGFFKLLPMLMVGLAVNNITPSGRGGGEPVRAYLLSKSAEEPFESSLATVVSDRALDAFPFLILSVFTVAYVLMYFNLSPIITGVLIAAVLMVLIFFLLLIYASINKKFGDKVTRLISKIAKNKFLVKLHKKDPELLEKRIILAVGEFQLSMQEMIRHKHILFYALPLSFIIWGFEMLRVYLVFLAFGADVSVLLLAVAFVLSSLIGMLPLLPGGLGTVDGLMILIFSSAGISPSVSAAATVIERLISFWLTTIIGFIILPYYGSSVLEKI
ncbi:MAG: UPF0104 family protein [Methanobacteriaceae archaeon]